MLKTLPRSIGAVAWRRDLVRPQRRGKPAQTARPLEAKRTAGFRTPAAWRMTVCTWDQRLDFRNEALRRMRRRQASRAQ